MRGHTLLEELALDGTGQPFAIHPRTSRHEQGRTTDREIEPAERAGRSDQSVEDRVDRLGDDREVNRAGRRPHGDRVVDMCRGRDHEPGVLPHRAPDRRVIGEALGAGRQVEGRVGQLSLAQRVERHVGRGSTRVAGAVGGQKAAQVEPGRDDLRPGDLSLKRRRQGDRRLGGAHDDVEAGRVARVIGLIAPANHGKDGDGCEHDPEGSSREAGPKRTPGHVGHRGTQRRPQPGAYQGQKAVDQGEIGGHHQGEPEDGDDDADEEDGEGRVVLGRERGGRLHD